MVIIDPRFLGELKDIPDHVISQAAAVEEVCMTLLLYQVLDDRERILILSVGLLT